jgi:hypothetical protein
VQTDEGIRLEHESGDSDRRNFRRLSASASRILCGLVGGVCLGALSSPATEIPAGVGAVAGGVAGLAVGSVAGVFVWATYPYRRYGTNRRPGTG